MNINLYLSEVVNDIVVGEMFYIQKHLLNSVFKVWARQRNHFDKF